MLIPCRKKLALLIRSPNLTIAKLAGTAILSILILFLTQWLVLLVIGLLLAALIFFTSIKWRQLKPFLMMIVTTVFFIFLVHAFSKEFLTGLVVSLQLTIVTLSSCFLISTTNELDIIYAAERLLKPLGKCKVNVEKLSFALFLCMRAIAILFDQYQQIYMAQKARGLQNHPLAIVLPMLLKMFRKANLITEALISRGFDLDND